MNTDQTEKKFVWIPDETKCYKKAFIVDDANVHFNNINSTILNDRHLDNDDHNKLIKVNCNNIILTLPSSQIYKTNPSKFDMVEDLSDLSYLNEPSVLHNLLTRYNHGFIYTYSGLFLLAINPYRDLNIYNYKYINKYFTNKKTDVEPHIYGVANEAYINMINNKENQSILITGESGAGKTENTKRVIIYLSSISKSLSINGNTKNNINVSENNSLVDFRNANVNHIENNTVDNFNKTNSTILDKIMTTNYILESFGNAKTVKNDNSSRFGKFIQIKFNNGTISGAHIEKYLLEKSRVVHQNTNERNYHIFYQLLSNKDICQKYYLNQSSYKYLTNGILITEQDNNNLKLLRQSFKIFNINEDYIFKILASILLLGEIEIISGGGSKGSFENAGERFKDGKNDMSGNVNGYFEVEHERLDMKNENGNKSNIKNNQDPKRNNDSNSLYIKNIDKVKDICNLLEIPYVQFINTLLNPVMKVSNEDIYFTRNKEQVYSIIKGLSKILYDKLFNQIINDINKNIYSSDNLFIGVLDIAGFEIYKENGFEQLCINYTNEKLQQYFNHHMFILEQEIYREENIEWNYIDFGLDLQPLIDLIESSNPIGILSYLDEECVMPKGRDETFLHKIRNLSKREVSNRKEINSSRNYIIDKNTSKIKNLDTGTNQSNSQFYNSTTEKSKNKNEKIIFSKKEDNSFTLDHYAGQVKYTVTDWITKNKDPNFEFINDLITKSDNKNISNLSLSDNIRQRGFFRTVSQKHKEQLNLLMSTLNKTNPHFVRCLIPNLDKSGDYFNNKLILDQLKCNGVLEGIRISRMGYPSRMSYEEFVDRYSIFINEITGGNSTDSINDFKNLQGATTNIQTTTTTENFIRDNTTTTTEIIKTLNLKSSQYKLGRTKIFFRQGILADIEDLRDIRIGEIMKPIQLIIREKLEIYKSNLFEIKKASSILIKKNAKIYLNISKWAWWKLYLKVKPLLDVNKKENLINELNKKIESNVNEIEILKNLINDKELLVSEQTSEIENMKLQIEYSKELIEGIRQEFNNEKNKMLNEIKEKDKIQKEMESKIFELESLKNEIENLNVKKEENLKKIKNDNDILKKESEEIKNEINLINSSNTQLKENNLILEKNVGDLKNENINLQNALLKDSKEKEHVVKILEKKKEQEIKDLENSLLKKIEESETEIKKIESENKNLNLEIKSKQEEKNKLEQEIELLKNEIFNLKIKIDEQEKNIKNLENDCLEQKIKINEKEKIIKEKDEEILNYKNKLNSINEEINDLSYENQKYESIINKLEKQVQDKDNIIRSMKLETINLNNSISKYKLEITNLDDTILKLKEHLNNTTVDTTEITKYKKLNLKMHDKIKILENSNIKLLKEIDEIKNENSNLVQTKMEEFFNSEREFNIINKKLTLENTSLNYTVKALKKELDELKGQSESSEDSQLEKLYNIIEKESAKRKEIEAMLIEKEMENHNLSLQLMNLTSGKGVKGEGCNGSCVDGCNNNSCKNLNESCNNNSCSQNKKEVKLICESINDTINKFNEKFFRILDSYKDKLKMYQDLINKNNNTINNLTTKLTEHKNSSRINEMYITELKENNLSLQKKYNSINKKFEDLNVICSELKIENESNLNKYKKLESSYKKLKEKSNEDINMYKENVENIDKNLSDLKNSYSHKLKECLDKKNLEIRELKNIIEENEIRIVELESVKYELECIKKLNGFQCSKDLNDDGTLNMNNSNNVIKNDNDEIIKKLKDSEKDKIILANELENYKQEIELLRKENEVYLNFNKNKKEEVDKLNELINNLELYKKSSELKTAQMEREINEYKEIVGVLKVVNVGRRKK